MGLVISLSSMMNCDSTRIGNTRKPYHTIERYLDTARTESLQHVRRATCTFEICEYSRQNKHLPMQIPRLNGPLSFVRVLEEVLS